MTQERALELIAILQAFVDGKEIEYLSDNTGRWHFASMLNTCICNGNELRVKPEPEIIPFDYSDDLVGMVVMYKYDETPAKQMIIFQNENGVGLYNETFIRCAELLENYTFLDGSPCGKERGIDAEFLKNLG